MWRSSALWTSRSILWFANPAALSVFESPLSAGFLRFWALRQQKLLS
jgi:hypothetical protein